MTRSCIILWLDEDDFYLVGEKKWPVALPQIAIIKIVGIHIAHVILVNALKKNLAGILNKIVV